MSLAKPLAGGLPIGAVLLKEKVAAAMKPGERHVESPLSTESLFGSCKQLTVPGPHCESPATSASAGTYLATLRIAVTEGLMGAVAGLQPLVGNWPLAAADTSYE
jgi:hypothetical protein